MTVPESHIRSIDFKAEAIDGTYVFCRKDVLGDTRVPNLKSKIESFFDIFTELRNVKQPFMARYHQYFPVSSDTDYGVNDPQPLPFPDSSELKITIKVCVRNFWVTIIIDL